MLLRHALAAALAAALVCTPFAAAAGEKGKDGKDDPQLTQQVDLMPVAIPINYHDTLVNYVFVRIRVHLFRPTDAPAIHTKEPLCDWMPCSSSLFSTTWLASCLSLFVNPRPRVPSIGPLSLLQPSPRLILLPSPAPHGPRHDQEGHPVRQVHHARGGLLARRAHGERVGKRGIRGQPESAPDGSRRGEGGGREGFGAFLTLSAFFVFFFE